MRRISNDAAKITIKDLLDRAEERARDPDNPPSGAARFLLVLPQLRAECRNDRPTWGFTAELVILASQMPSKATNRRLFRGKQRSIAKKRRPRRPDRLMKFVRRRLKHDPKLSTKEIARIVKRKFGARAEKRITPSFVSRQRGED